MESNQVDDRRKHLLGVLTEFLEDKIYNQLPDQDFFDQSSEGHESTSESQGSIPDSEVERFADVDLKLLDNKAYFKTVFEPKE